MNKIPDTMAKTSIGSAAFNKGAGINVTESLAEDAVQQTMASRKEQGNVGSTDNPIYKGTRYHFFDKEGVPSIAARNTAAEIQKPIG